MANCDSNKTSQKIFDKDNPILKQTELSSLKSQRSSTINTNTNHRSLNDYKQRSMTLSNGMDQVIEFIQQKFSRPNNEEKQEFDDLKTIK